MIPGALQILFCLSIAEAVYQVGVGIADITGPATGIRFMGYANPNQVGCGIHLRQFARAFVFCAETDCVIFVNLDAAASSDGVQREVIKNLTATYGTAYNYQNVIISSTHTHSGPGGYLDYFLYDLSILGFVKESFNIIVEGALQAIKKAHESKTESRMFINSGIVLDANINRSPASYLLNPEEERAKYEYNVDKELTQIKIVRTSDNVIIGALQWFAVHPVSMNNTNCLISSDNVGYASVLLERFQNNGSLPGKGSFVGAVASSNLGDVSPNTKGPICIDTGEPCDFKTSTCNGNTQNCIAFGPGDDMFESNKIIAEKIFEKAKELLQASGTEVNGPIKSIHQFIDMPKAKGTTVLSNGTIQQIKGCHPAMGVSFAAGTTDGPGLFPFSQGSSASGNMLWDLSKTDLIPPTLKDAACHHPKKILLNTGRICVPYKWQPDIVPTQIIMMGSVAIVAVPGEFTTMSGRRLRQTVKDIILRNGGSDDTKVVLAGHSGSYSSYIATAEEYQLQRYEGGSTIYGPNTLLLYQQQYARLAEALLNGTDLGPGPAPPQFSQHLISLVLPPTHDNTRLGKVFGDCVQQPPSTISRGQTITTKFACGNPRHDSLAGDSYLFIERLENNEWVLKATDASWETKFIWKRTNLATAESECTIEWTTTHETESGVYRIRHRGPYKTLTGQIKYYTGETNNFNVQE